MPNIYLENISIDDALTKYLPHLSPFPLSAEKIPVTDALGRTTAEAVFAAANAPLYDCAAMDGIAVVAAHTQPARDIAPLTLAAGRFADVDTGDPIPLPYDAVIMVEDIQRTADGGVILRKAVPSYQHIRAIGEDVVKGELILPSGHTVRPVDIGALLSGGITDTPVTKPPTVAIIPTGSELVEPGGAIQAGSIIESNSRMLEAMVKTDGMNARRFPIVPDDEDALRQTLAEAAESCDMVLLCSGTSAGREDFTKKTIEALGTVIVHGVAIKPGKPAILAVIHGKPVVGVPGYPVSAYIVYKNLVAPVIQRLAGQLPKPTQTVRATLTKRLVSSLKHKEFVRVKLGMINGQFIATPLSRGAGAGMSLVKADGFCIIPLDLEGIESGETVEISLLRDVKDLESTIISIGSHDIIMDILADEMGASCVLARASCAGQLPTEAAYLSSAHVGTMGGLMALKNKECHLAPIHHLDEATGTYNTAIVRQLFPGQKMALIKGVQRVQGLMVAKGNPLDIAGIADLARCRYVNRSRGTGTRMFLDYHLRQAGIDAGDINGYDREASTHMNVGGIIAGGGADAGLGIMSAAQACGLDFVPIGVEDYDFALYADTLDQVQPFIRQLKSAPFHKKLDALGGYTYKNTGEVVFVE